MSSPEPPIQIVKNGLPIFFPANEFETKRVEIFREIEKGVDEFINQIADSPLSKLSIDNSMITYWINDFLCNPRLIDREAFKSVYHSSQPNHTDLRYLDVFKKNNGIKIRLRNYLLIHPRLHKLLRLIEHILRIIK